MPDFLDQTDCGCLEADINIYVKSDGSLKVKCKFMDWELLRVGICQDSKTSGRGPTSLP